MIHIVATSDLHGHLPNIPKCDLFIVGGDVCPGGTIDFQAKWLDVNFREWLEKIPAKEIVGIAGNHDLIFERAPQLIPDDLPWHYLRDSEIELFDFKIYGTPWQLPFWGAFNLEEESLKLKYQDIPKDIDILVSHGPPQGLGDEVIGHDNFKRHVGSLSLRNKIFEIMPKLIIYGHIHSAYGIWKINHMTFANVSLLNDEMEEVHRPANFELQK